MFELQVVNDQQKKLFMTLLPHIVNLTADGAQCFALTIPAAYGTRGSPLETLGTPEPASQTNVSHLNLAGWVQGLPRLAPPLRNYTGVQDVDHAFSRLVVT